MIPDLRASAIFFWATTALARKWRGGSAGGRCRRKWWSRISAFRGIDLTYALLDPYELVILVDACARGGEPGSVYLIEPELTEGPTAPFEAHSMNPMNVLRTVRQMGGVRGRILIVGCEPADLGPEDGKLGLSDVVEAAIGEAIGMIEKLVAETLGVSQSH